MGERVTTMFSKPNPETSLLFTVRREVLIMGSIENWLVEGAQEDDADIRSDTIQDLKRNLATKRCCGDVVKDIDRIPSTSPGAEPLRDARDSGSARSHSMHLETSSSDRP